MNINVPTCAPGFGTIRGTLPLPLSTSVSLSPANCLSIATPTDDIDGFLNGFITVTSIGTAGSIT